MVQHSEQVLRAQDGHDIHIQVWQPDGDCSHVIHIVHGLGEYAARYRRFAEFAAAWLNSQIVGP